MTADETTTGSPVHTCPAVELPALAFTHSRPFDRSQIAPVRNQPHHSKPTGGLWLAPLRPDGRSGWQDWCESGQEDALDPGEVAFTVTPVCLSSTARVAVVDTLDDLIALTRLYPPSIRDDEVSVLVRTLAQSSLLPDCFSPPVDWEALSEDFDALWLTCRGAAQTRRPRAPGDPDLNSWDIETVLVLNASVVAVG